ncbi:MAG: arsenic resistance protein [Thermoplasmata archaeon]|jgi:ACR3 family arsenite efflux pump ArsB|uniref:arsenic resistance protein n=1 Tax=Caldisericum sp. TaxID=2499687 RepID=UPI003C9FCDBC
MEEKSKLVKLREHLDKFLAVYVVIWIIIGYLLGITYPGWVKANSTLINELMMASIFIMIFPMMLMLNLSGLVKAFKSWKMLLIVLLMNFGWGPLMAVLLGNIFVSDPLLRLGIFLAWLVPCSSMSIGYVGLMRGNIEAATALVAITFIVGIPVIPLFAGWYGSIYHLSVSMTLLIITIIEIIIVPLIVGLALHQYMVKKMGMEKFRKISPLFPSITTLGMFMIVFFIFLGHAVLVTIHFSQVIGVFYTAMVYGTISLIFMTFLLKYLKFDYWDSMAMIFPSIGKNEATAIAIAATAFSPFVAIPPAIFPIFQIVFLITYIKLRPRIAHFYGIKTRDVEFKEIHMQTLQGAK